MFLTVEESKTNSFTAIPTFHITYVIYLELLGVPEMFYTVSYYKVSLYLFVQLEFSVF